MLSLIPLHSRAEPGRTLAPAVAAAWPQTNGKIERSAPITRLTNVSRTVQLRRYHPSHTDLICVPKRGGDQHPPLAHISGSGLAVVGGIGVPADGREAGGRLTPSPLGGQRSWYDGFRGAQVPGRDSEP
jgi:hypothetical protein